MSKIRKKSDREVPIGNGDKVLSVHVELNRDGTVKAQQISEYTVIASNEDYSVLDNRVFETISRWKTRDKVKVYRELDVVSISFEKDRSTMERLFGYCRVTVYSTQPMRKVQTLIRKALEKRIREEMAFYGSFDPKSIKLEIS